MNNVNLNIKKLGIAAEKSDSPLLIAGPCSVETEAQLDETVKGLAAQGIKMIRGGVWKPRTRPNTFEGVGEIALGWIQKVKKKYEVQFCIEVASPYHVEKALNAGIDLLWIGARTTVNPFNVQEIADSLKGVDIPILVKNPVNPDLSLWIGALERLHQAGIQRLGAIHRGFSSFKHSKYRNTPNWQIPIELKTLFPELPIICDPSHITGNRALLKPISQKALDLGFDGLMIETHPNPDEAWSDAAQQITPAVYQEMIASLVIRRGHTDHPDFTSRLEDIRAQIDQADHDILAAIAHRMSLVKEIGEYKKEHNVTAFQRERWIEIFETRTHWGEMLHLHADFIKELYKLVHDESIRKQTEILNDKENINNELA
jgi:chorismate mutase